MQIHTCIHASTSMDDLIMVKAVRVVPDEQLLYVCDNTFYSDKKLTLMRVKHAAMVFVWVHMWSKSNSFRVQREVLLCLCLCVKVFVRGNSQC